jgi:glycosyltransferase involved in cell wall biosynthesis
LSVVGDDETRLEEGFGKQLVNACCELGIEDRVLYLSFNDYVPDFIAEKDVFVMPSYNEVFRLVFTVAMSIDKLIGATDKGGVAEIGDDGIDDLVISRCDERSLSEEIVLALKGSLLTAFFSKRQ